MANVAFYEENTNKTSLKVSKIEQPREKYPTFLA